MLQNHLPRRVFLVSLLVSWTGSLAIVLAMILAGGFTETRGQLLMTALACGGFSITGLGAAMLYRHRKYWPLPETGVLVSLLGFILVSVGIWTMPDSDGYWQASAIVAILAASLAQTCLLLWSGPRQPAARYTCNAAIIMGLLLALLANLAIALQITSELFWRWVVVLTFADGLGTIIALALTWITPLRDNQLEHGAEVGMAGSISASEGELMQ